MILCIETATSLCSVALCDRDGVVITGHSDDSRSHASQLTILIGQVLRETGMKASGLEAVVVSRGPGSYTGLRIGVSTAKGIAWGASIPLIGVDTTLSMFHGYIEAARKKHAALEHDLFCPVLDARRMEVYYAVYNAQGNTVTGIGAAIVDNTFPPVTDDSERIFIFGDAAVKCREVINRNNVFFDEDFRISSSSMMKPAYEALDKKQFEDVAYFEPFYLKDFLATKPVKNILGT
ncbi:MAG: tRNA (adenosine(37)-N6)-threonylcarbamoyltransferase complex dimerization subunit type 1 TsaB [Bacteroidales bacterium]|nr:tRNA (adenosine(37)-N6)-threonylcarbamoyltransferase complex dimerization subunit type 1 TsaB [Bacteroidales bacterium]